jgi:hypothetical protein
MGIWDTVKAIAGRGTQPARAEPKRATMPGNAGDLLGAVASAIEIAESATRSFDKARGAELPSKISDAVKQIHRAWSGSCIGYHSNLYLQGLVPRRPQDHFDSEWGMERRAYGSHTRGAWTSYEYEGIEEAALQLAGVSKEDFDAFIALQQPAGRAFETARDMALPALEAVAEVTRSSALAGVVAEVKKLKQGFSEDDLARVQMPRQVMSRDSRAIQGGMPVPPHIMVVSLVGQAHSRRDQLDKLCRELTKATQLVNALGIATKITEDPVKTDGAPDKKAVFVVHGRDARARTELYAFLRALGLRVLEWEHVSAQTGSASPYNGEVVDAAFRAAQAVVILFAGEDVAYLRDDLAGAKRETPGFQPRPNVLIETGMALMASRDRTVIVQSGVSREPSDLHGL